MALKPYSELVKIDVKPFCDSRKAKDDSGKQIDVFYLNWAKCIELLYANGAESAYYVPLKASNDSYVFTHYETQNKDGRKTGCYFVEVNVMIDGKPYPMSYNSREDRCARNKNIVDKTVHCRVRSQNQLCGLSPR
jgi:hypothetical protein